MNKEVYYPMSQKQLGRYVTISKLIEKQLTVKQAAISLGLSTRQILSLKKGVKTSGANALLHKNSGRKPSHALAESLREKIIALKKHLQLGFHSENLRENSLLFLVSETFSNTFSLKCSLLLNPPG